MVAWQFAILVEIPRSIAISPRNMPCGVRMGQICSYVQMDRAIGTPSSCDYLRLLWRPEALPFSFSLAHPLLLAIS